MSTIPDEPERDDRDDGDDRDRREEGDGVLSAEELQFAPLIAKLREWDLPYEVDRQYPISKIDRSESTQVRDVTNIAPAMRVEEYTQQMRNGAIFPPILIRTNRALIDGNTRIAAAKRVGRKTYPTIIVDTPTAEVAKILAAAVNMMGGERLKPHEAHEAALLMMQTGYPDAAVARELGRDLGQVRRWRTQRAVTERAESLGLDKQVQQIPRTTLASLAGVNFEAPFTELTRLFADVRPTEREAKELVAEVMQEPSETAAVAKVVELREQLAPVGPPPRAGTRTIPLVRAAIGNLLKLKGRVEVGLDMSKRDDELARWEQVRELVDEVLAALRQR